MRSNKYLKIHKNEHDQICAVGNSSDAANTDFKANQSARLNALYDQRIAINEAYSNDVPQIYNSTMAATCRSYAYVGETILERAQRKMLPIALINSIIKLKEEHTDVTIITFGTSEKADFTIPKKFHSTSRFHFMIVCNKNSGVILPTGGISHVKLNYQCGSVILKSFNKRNQMLILPVMPATHAEYGKLTSFKIGHKTWEVRELPNKLTIPLVNSKKFDPNDPDLSPIREAFISANMEALKYRQDLDNQRNELQASKMLANASGDFQKVNIQQNYEKQLTEYKGKQIISRISLATDCSVIFNTCSSDYPDIGNTDFLNDVLKHSTSGIISKYHTTQTISSDNPDGDTTMSFSDTSDRCTSTQQKPKQKNQYNETICEAQQKNIQMHPLLSPPLKEGHSNGPDNNESPLVRNSIVSPKKHRRTAIPREGADEQCCCCILS